MATKASRSAARLMISPAVLLLLGWMIIPLVMTVYFSFLRYNLLQPGDNPFVGWENYYWFLTDPSFKSAMINTLVLVGGVLAITTFGGILFALLLDRPMFGQGIIRIMVIAPFFVMPTVSGLVWKNMFMNPVNGIFAYIAKLFGTAPIDFFGQIPLASIIFIVSWQWLPFATLILLTALQGRGVQARSDYFKHFSNSVIIAVGSTLLGLLIAIPAAWAMAFTPSKHTKNVLMWMLSTKMLPPVGVLIPIYLIFRDFNLLDTRSGLVFVLMMINLPIIVWMLYTYFKEIPGEILEASRMDGAGLREEVMYVLAPMAVPGIASTVLLNIILAWNEAFWTLRLTAGNAAPLTAFIASYSSPEGLFYAKLSAASIMAIAPILIMGWFSQKQLVRGLTFGAVK